MSGQKLRLEKEQLGRRESAANWRRKSIPDRLPGERTRSRVKYVIFDWGDVFISGGLPLARRAFSRRLGIDINKLWRTEMKQSWKKWERGQMSAEDFWKKLADTIDDTRFDVEDFKRFIAATQTRDEEVVELIAKLRKEGYVTALLTNNTKEWIEDYDRRDPFGQHFDAVISSHHVGLVKPEPRIYQIMMEQLGAKPEECVFIDDKKKNVRAARALGMQGIIFKSAEQTRGELEDILGRSGSSSESSAVVIKEKGNSCLYKLKTNDAGVRIYARDKRDIIDLVKYYYERARRNGHLNDPRLAEWVRKVPTCEDILAVEKGEIFFQAGMISFAGDNNRQFWEELRVLPDFTVFTNEESLLNFEFLRRALPQLKRVNLYKIMRDGGIAPSLNFIPQDVMEATLRYDLTPHLEKARETLNRIQRIKEGHPNLM